MTVTNMTYLEKIDSISSTLFIAWRVLEDGESYADAERARNALRLAAEDLYAVSQDLHKKLLEAKQMGVLEKEEV